LKILILKPSSLGDVVQALPVLRLLRQHLPEARIWWWLDQGLMPLLEGDPDLAGIIPFNRRRWGSPRHWGELLGSIRGIRAHHFDWVIDLQSLARSGLVAWLANGRLLVGLDDAREGARGFYDIAVRRPGPMTHAVDWYCEVLRVLGVPVHSRFEWIPPRPQVAAAVLRQGPDDGRRWVVLLPGARWENKRWPTAAFGRLGRLLVQADPSLRCVILGGPGEAGLGRPVVAVFGPTEPRRTGPYGQSDRVLQHRGLACVPCMSDRCQHVEFLACLHAIGPAQVAERVLAVLAGTVSQEARGATVLRAGPGLPG
jgi:ADP-heptose:LPS heptosyltransferase